MNPLPGPHSADLPSADTPERPSATGDAGEAPVIRGLNIPQRLSLIVLVVAIPMLLLSAASVWRSVERERELSRQAIVYSAHSVLSAVDAQLGKYVSVAHVLASSPSLARNDLSAFRESAQRALAALSSAGIALVDPDGQQLVNTFASPDEPLPRVPPERRAAEIRAFETRQMQIADVAVGPVVKVPVIAVVVPVFRAGEPVYSVMVGVNVTVFRDLLNSQRIPDGWLAGIMDRSGKFVARSLDHERLVGQAAGTEWRAVMNQEGIFGVSSLEGDNYTAANAVSPLSGWTLGVAAKKEVFDAPIRQTLVISSLIGLGVTMSSILFAAWAAQRITAPIKALERGAVALRHHEPVSFAPTQVPEVDHALRAFDTASKELRAHEERRAKSEMALKASEERLRVFVEQAPASIAMLDRNMRYLAVSRRWLAQYNPHETDIIGRSHYEQRPEIPERWREMHCRALGGEVVAAEDDPLPRADGRTLWLSWEARPWRSSDGAIGGIVIFSDDVTSRHEAVAALKDSEERYERLANAANEGVLIYDDLRIIEANASFLRMFDCTKEEIAEKSLDQFFPPESRHQTLARMRCKAGEIYETLALRKNGSTFPIELSGNVVRYAGRDMRVGLVRDLTEEKRAEEERRLLQAELLHASRLSEIGQMAAALAHELNQPLTAVTSYIGGCRRLIGSDLSEESRKRKLLEIMELANAQALRAGEIIRRLREFIGTGQTERRVENAAAVMREASTLTIADAKHNGVSIRFDIDKPGSILVNKVQIQQVIVNLVRNAIEAMETTSRKELEIGITTKDDCLELCVRDTGSGLSPEMTDRLFKPFSSTKTNGMGIGLSVCREIVESHDGKIWAEPNPGGGTVFRFTLPLVREMTA